MAVELKKVWVAKTTRANELKPADLLTYSALGSKDSFGETTNHRQVSFATGLNEKTVARSVERLKECGLIVDGHVCNGRPDWFLSTDNGKHWFKDMWHWNYYTPKDIQGGLSVLDSFIYCYLLDCVTAKKPFSPPNGWSAAYLASAINLDKRTVEERLTTLAALRLVSPIFQVRTELTLAQQCLFKPKGERSAATPGHAISVWDDDVTVDAVPPEAIFGEYAPTEIGPVHIRDYCRAKYGKEEPPVKRWWQLLKYEYGFDNWQASVDKMFATSA